MPAERARMAGEDARLSLSRSYAHKLQADIQPLTPGGFSGIFAGKKGWNGKIWVSTLDRPARLNQDFGFQPEAPIPINKNLSCLTGSAPKSPGSEGKQRWWGKRAQLTRDSLESGGGTIWDADRTWRPLTPASPNKALPALSRTPSPKRKRPRSQRPPDFTGTGHRFLAVNKPVSPVDKKKLPYGPGLVTMNSMANTLDASDEQFGL